MLIAENYRKNKEDINGLDTLEAVEYLITGK